MDSIEFAFEDIVMGWVRELLEDPAVAPEDNFLIAGGHSMLAVELNQLVVDRFDAELDIQVLFESSLREAIADLARHAGAQTGGAR